MAKAAAETLIEPADVKPAKTKTKHALAVVAPPRDMLAIIASAAANPLVDVAKMKELLAMQREIEQRQEDREFNAAMLAAQNNMPRITRDRENTHTKSRYATLEKVSKEIDKIVRSCGFTLSFGTEDSTLAGHYRVVCDVSHVGGTTRRYIVDLKADEAGSQGKANKTPVQAVGSTISYGRRYLKMMIFDLAIVGEDNDGVRTRQTDDAPAVITAAQLEQLVEFAAAAECPEHKLVGFLNTNRPAEDQGRSFAKLAALPAARFDEAVRAIQAWEAARKKKAVQS